MSKPTHILVKTAQVKVKPDAQMPPEGASPAKLQEMLNPENIIDAFPIDTQNGVHGFSIQGGTLLILRGKRTNPEVAVAYAGGEWQRAWEASIPQQASIDTAAKVEKFPQPAP
jgi:hypothetical protein